jgi:hypothetical protein
VTVKESNKSHVQNVLRKKPVMDWRSERDCANTVCFIPQFTSVLVEKKLTTGNMIVLMSDRLKR